MIDRIPYLAAVGAGMGLAAIPASNGISYLDTAAAGIIGAILLMAIWGSYHAGRSAAIKQLHNGDGPTPIDAMRLSRG